MKSKQTPPKAASKDALSLNDAAMEESLFPLWDIYDKLVLFEPKPAFEPVHWEYTKVRPLLQRSGREISTEEAERRVLLFKNPAFQKPYTTHTLAAGFQLLKQGETEGSHRHTQAAIRLVVEGSGGYTTTGGERIWMHPGDFITTPSWTWHDHGKPKAGDGDLIWLDGIDVPLINYWHLTFSEFTEGEKQQDLLVPDADSHYKYGSGLLPVTDNRLGSASPIYAYPYERTREVFEKLERASDWDPYFGRKLIFSNPRDGGHVMPTIAAFMQHLPKGFKTKKYRSTDAAIYTVVEGKGQATIGNKVINWAKGDVFVVPNWTYVEFTALESSMLFSFSDRAAQERLCLWREDKPA